LDPSRFFFDASNREIRLDETDAKHVDVIHSNSGILLEVALGVKRRIGHADFYPNGGKYQTGCQDGLDSVFESLSDLIHLNFTGQLSDYACNHFRSVDYFIESINSPCPFIAYKCPSFSQYTKGQCFNMCQNNDQCSQMGYHWNKSNTGEFLLSTLENEQGPYCKRQYRIDVDIPQTQAETKGQLLASVISLNEKSQVSKLHDGTIKGGQIITNWLDVSQAIFNSRAQDAISGLTLKFKPNSSVRTLGVSRAVVRTVGKGLELEKKQFNSTVLEDDTETSLE